MAKRKVAKSFKKGNRPRRRRFFDNESKQVYYRYWLNGYNDSYASNNVIAAQQEYAREKSYYEKPWQHSLMKGYIAGMKAQLADRKKGKYKREE